MKTITEEERAKMYAAIIKQLDGFCVGFAEEFLTDILHIVKYNRYVSYEDFIAREEYAGIIFTEEP